MPYLDRICQHVFTCNDVSDLTRYCHECGFVMKSDEFTYRINKDGEPIAMDLGPGRNECRGAA